MNYEHDKNGRFARKGNTFVLVVMVVSAGVLAAGYFGVEPWLEERLTTKIEYVAPVVEAATVTPGDVEEMRRKVVKDLSDKCELVNKSGKPYTIDSNGRGGQQVVFGDMQFEPDTVRGGSKQFLGKEISYDEAIILALDESRAHELADMIIFKEDTDWQKENGGIFHWYNCAKKLQLVPIVKFIREYQNQ